MKPRTLRERRMAKLRRDNPMLFWLLQGGGLHQ